MKVIVADDEAIARASLLSLLNEQADIEEVIETDNGEDTVALAWKLKPQVIFLDIQMPKGLGIEIISELPKDSVVIFTTAYNEYAVEAFQKEAIDYLLKPFDDTRFFQALDRARTRLQEKSGSEQTVNSENEVREYLHQIVVKDPGRIRLIEVESLAYIVGAGNYVELHPLDGKPILHRESLTRLEEQLNPALFLRVHRSAIVRKDQITELRPNAKGDYQLLLKTGESIMMSRSYKEKLESILGQ